METLIYYLYRITNKINGKIYIGIHKTSDIDDGYFGSGVYINRAITKYGIENFEKDILEFFEDEETMYKREAEIVNEAFVLRKDTYNIREGGFGTFNHINRTGKNLYGLNGKSGHGLENLVTFDITSKKLKDEGRWDDFIENVSKGVKKHFTENGHPWVGRSHKEESKKKIGEANSKIQKGEGNSQYGTCWMHSLEEQKNIKIKKEEIDNYLSMGYTKGRKMKF
jgi:hypothetical protein